MLPVLIAAVVVLGTLVTGAGQGVGQGMERDISVRMAGELGAMRNVNAAESDVCSLFKSVNVIPISNPDIREADGEILVSHFYIALPGQLDVLGRSFDDFHGNAEIFCD